MQDLHQNEDIREKGIPKEMELIVAAKKDIPRNIITSLQLMVKMLESQKKGDEIIINENSKYFRIGRMINYNKNSFETDLDILKDNRISITPLSLNLTNNKLLNELK